MKRATLVEFESVYQHGPSHEQTWMVAHGRIQLCNSRAWRGRTLEAKLVEAKSKKDTLKARAKSAATSKQISDMLQGLNSSNAVTAFERMEEKVMALEGEAEATLQV